MDNKPITIVVDRVQYRKDDFCVLQTTSSLHGPISVVGSLPFGSAQVREGTVLAIHATETMDPKWGRQLRPGPVLLPLAADPRVVLHGAEIGSEVQYLAMLLVARHADAALLSTAILRGDPKEVEKLSGVSAKVAEHTVRGWQRFVTAAKLTAAMRRAHVSTSEIWSAMRSGLDLGIVLQNPWALAEKRILSLPRVDGLAEALGITPTPEVRARILVRELLDRYADAGDTCVRVQEVVAEMLREIPEWDTKRCVELLRQLPSQGIAILSRPPSGEAVVYAPVLHHWEVESARLLADRLVTAKPHPASPIGQAMLRISGKATLEDAAEVLSQEHLHLSPAQRAGLRDALVCAVFLLTGLPGTGKTTTLRALVATLHQVGANVLAVAPTGVAARRVRQLCGVPAHTFHAAFGYQPSRNLDRGGDYVGLEGGNRSRAADAFSDDWRHGPTNPVDADVLIVDESSMMDLSLFYRALAATRPECRIILVGDPAQIPSVGPGSVLRDLLQVDEVPRVHLNGIFRQTMASPVVLAAHAIYEGRSPAVREVLTPEEALNPAQEDDVCLLHAGSDEEALHLACEVVDPLYRGAKGVGAVQLLSPRHGGEAGVTRFNEVLRTRLNPKGPDVSEVKVASGVIRQGDRVMIVKNDAELGVYNGDVGEVREATTTGGGRIVEVRLDGSPPHIVTLTRDQPTTYLRLAYAVTYHKSQAMEYEVVVIVLLPSFGNQVTRRLLYTAVTRAKKRVVIVGTHEAIASAIYRTGDDTRTTYLKDRVLQQIDARRSSVLPVGGVSPPQEACG